MDGLGGRRHPNALDEDYPHGCATASKETPMKAWQFVGTNKTLQLNEVP